MSVWPAKAGLPPYPKPESCRTCPLWGNGRGFGFPSYGGSNGVLLVGEALGEQEAKTGAYFQGPAGWQLDHILRRAGLKREDFAGLGNVITCRPPGNKLGGQWYTQEAIRKCAPFLDEVVERAQPKAIVALGGIPLSRMAGQSGITRNRGFVFEGLHNVPVVGTFHPSYLLPRRKEKSSSKYTWVVIMDIRKALRIAAGERRNYPQHYLLDPSVDRAAEFMSEFERERFGTKMTWDLETLYKMKTKNEQKMKLEDKQTVLRVSFAWRPGYAMTVPAIEPYLSRVILPFFASNCVKVGWNDSGFDRPIVIFQERWPLNGLLLDGMDAFHVFQPNIERNLEFVTSICSEHLRPWKHLAQAEPELYSATDADAQITNVLRLDEWMSQMDIGDKI